MKPSSQMVRLFLLVEIIGFAAAALIHAGALTARYVHAEARTAESLIALVLFIGLSLSLVRPTWTRRAGLAVQAFALLGTLVGLFTIIIGIGPRTIFDILLHAAFVVVLSGGLIVTARTADEPI